MEFLPLEIDGERVYVGAWRRLGAYALDFLIILPFLALEIRVRLISSSVAVATVFVYFVALMAYRVAFPAVLGGTPGKLIVGIRITRPDGSRIGWREAIKREAVDFILGVILIVGTLPVILGMPPAALHHLAGRAQIAYEKAHEAPWYLAARVAFGIWTYSDIGTLLFNPRKRALHDLVAGTVVVRKRFVEQALRADAQETGIS